MGLKSQLTSLRRTMDPILREAKFTFHRLKQNVFSLAGILIIIFFIGVAVMAPLIAPPEPNADPYKMKMREDWQVYEITPPPTPPSSDHPFGTVAGYDICYGCIWGTRTAFRVGLQVTLIALAIGLFIGCLAGYFGGILDTLLMGFTDLFLALPGLLLAIVLIAATEPPAWLGTTDMIFTLSRLDKIIVALAVAGWPTYARLIRGEVLKVKTENYVEAANAIGCSNLRIIFVHILPNSISPVIAMASLNIGGAVLVAATLSFLGIGIPVGYADWAPFIASARNYVIGSGFQHAYTFMIPGAFLISFVIGWTLIGDTLTDMLNPRTRRM